MFNNRFLVKIGTALTRLGFALGLPIKGIVRNTIFWQFVGGESLEETINLTDKLGDYHIASLLDYGVEGKSNEAEFDRTARELERIIEIAGSNPNVIGFSSKLTGLGRTEIYEKIQSGQELTEEEHEAFQRMKSRFSRICEQVSHYNISILADAEESWIQDTLDELITGMMMSYNKERVAVYHTIQCYRHDRLDYLKSLYQHAVDNDYLLGIKTVRGAYMEKERKRAASMGYESPIHPNKELVDRDYNDALEFCLKHIDRISLINATHNEDSTALLAEKMDEMNLNGNNPHIMFSQLYGMGDHLTYNLANAGFRSCKLLPYGPVREVIPYLIRRAEENSSVRGQVSREFLLIKQEIKRRKRL